MQNIDYKEINRIPSLTWNWLKMNRAALKTSLPENATHTMSIANTANAVISTDENDFTAAEKAFIAATKADATEDAKSLISLFGAETVSVRATKQTKAEEPVRIHHEAKSGTSSCVKHAVIAEENTEITVIADYTSEKTNNSENGFEAIRTILHAKPNSKIHLVKVQLLQDDFSQVDGTFALAEDGAQIRITQIVLGGSNTYIDTKCTLSGYSSDFRCDTAYHAKSNQMLDMNYESVNIGSKSNTKMIVKGVVSDKATKTYRGTIDFKRGCTGSTGEEQEETLLLSPTAVNKSLPVILCAEDDMSGTHGSTIGRIGADELFYFQSRGIDEKAAEKILSQAKIKSIADEIPDEELKDKISAFIGIELDE